MTRLMPMMEARNRLTHLPEDLSSGRPDTVAVTRRGKPVLAILPWEHYEAIVETLEVLSDPKLMAALRKSAEDIKRGRTYTSDQVRKRLGM